MNKFTNYFPVDGLRLSKLLEDGLWLLESNLHIAGRVWRDALLPSGTDEIRIPLPNKPVVTDISNETPQTLVPNALSFKINKAKRVQLCTTAVAASLPYEKLLALHVRPAMVALAEEVEKDVIAALGMSPFMVPTQTTTGIAFRDLTNCIAKMSDLGYSAPMHQLHFTLSTPHRAAFSDLPQITSESGHLTHLALMTGAIGQTMGVQVSSSPYIPPITGLAANSSGVLTLTNVAYAPVPGTSKITVYSTTLLPNLIVGTSIYVPRTDSWHTVTGLSAVNVPTTYYRELTVYPPVQERTNPAVPWATTDSFLYYTYVGQRSFLYNPHSVLTAYQALEPFPSSLGGGDMQTIISPANNLSLRLIQTYEPRQARRCLYIEILYGVSPGNAGTVQLVGGA